MMSEMEEAELPQTMMVRQSQPRCKNVRYFSSVVERHVAVLGDTSDIRKERLERAKIKGNDWSCMEELYEETMGG